MVEEDFNLDRVIVVLKHEYSTVNKIYKVSDFDSSLFCEVTDLSYIENYSTNDEINVNRVNEENFQQILSLKLRNPGKESVLKAVAYLNTCDEVLSAEPDYIYKCKDLYVPNDTYYDEQWGLESINIEDAWDETRGSTTVKVGVFENGLSSHEDIASGRIIQGTRQYNSGEIHSHGTVVTGVIGATSNNNKGVAGVAQVKLAMLDRDSFEESLVYAANNNIMIINASFCFLTTDGDYSGFISACAAAIQNYPGLLICAAGNENVNLDNEPWYPAAYELDNVITVAATNENDVLYTYYDDGNLKGSNYSATPDYVLITLRTNMAYDMGVASVFGDYIMRESSGSIPYSYGKCIYIPQNGEVYSLDTAYQMDIEDFDNIFTEVGLGRLIGDMDKDKKLTVKDATYIQKCLAGIAEFDKDDYIDFGYNTNETITIRYLSDFNRDGVRNIKDATAIQKHIARIEVQ